MNTGVDMLLKEVQTNHLFLLPCGECLGLWAPNIDVPLTTRRGIWQHKKSLLEMIGQADVRVCPSRDLHRKYWYHVSNQDYRCGMCEQLGPEVERNVA